MQFCTVKIKTILQYEELIQDYKTNEISLAMIKIKKL